MFTLNRASSNAGLEQDNYKSIYTNFRNNLGRLFTFVTELNYNSFPGYEREEIDKAKKAVIKLWDYMSIDDVQWSELKYIYSVENREGIKEFEEKVSETNRTHTGQVITLVGIFTALAFLLFGGLSLEDTAVGLANKVPLTKLLCIMDIWTLGMMNIIYVLMYCISRMTNVSFKANINKDAAFSQKYPVVMWSNYLLLSILLVLLWAYFILPKKMDLWFFSFSDHLVVTWIVLVSVTVLLLLSIVLVGRKLHIVTQNSYQKKKAKQTADDQDGQKNEVEQQ